MKIYTRTGDKGETSLFGGQRVGKDHLRIEAYGTIDELNAWIGTVRDGVDDADLDTFLHTVQARLFDLGAYLSSPDPAKVEQMVAPFSDADIERLEAGIDAMEVGLPPLKTFILPGGHPAVSATHVARCVCRRAERRLVELGRSIDLDPVWVRYLNRLSDHLFVLGRRLAHDLEIDEIPWVPQPSSDEGST